MSHSAHRLHLLAAVAVTAPLLSVHAQVRQEYSPDSTPPKRVVIAGAVEVPLVASGIEGAQLPVIEAMVNGHGPFRFGIETGARFVAMRRALADSLGLRRTGGPDELPEYRVDSINIAGVSFKDLAISGRRRGATGVDGVLGLPLYQDVLLTIDYPSQRVRFERDTLPTPNGRDVFALTRAGPFWAVPVRIGERDYQAIIDTRAMGAFGATPEIASQFTFDGELRVVGRAGGAGIPETDVKEGRLSGDVRLGAYTFPHPLIGVRALPSGFPTEPLVGAPVLSNFVVSLDQQHGRVRLLHDGSPVIRLTERTIRQQPPTVSGGQAEAGLAEYVGQYGDRTISLAGGILHLQRPRGELLEMIPKGRDTFGLKEVPAAQIAFMRDAIGRVTEIRVLNRQGVWETALRDAHPPE